MNTERKAALRDIPSVDKMLGHPGVKLLMETHPRPVVVDAVRESVDAVRALLRSGEEVASDEVSPDALVHVIEEFVAKASEPSLRRAINATGIIIHTGLGRAPLAEAAREAVKAASGSCVLEIDRETGKRGSRTVHVEPLLCELTDAEAATAVNNNAAAVFLAMNTLARGGEVIVSRGQAVEIGGSFRIPDIVRRSGCRLVEVGTTNKTRIEDYENAITDETMLILRVHPSNFRVVGFVEETPLEELVALGRELAIPVMDDLGSGALIDLSEWGLTGEPMVQESVRAGCQVVTFSGDKLLGGPQAGIMVGTREAIDECKSNPLARALRLDKLTLAALEATLRLYRDPCEAAKEIPVLRSITASPAEIEDRANRLAEGLVSVVGPDFEVTVVGGVSQVGGGSLPGQDLPTSMVALKSPGLSADDLSEGFRGHSVPIFGRISEGLFLLDARTITDEEVEVIVSRARGLGEN
ncbi:MAG: L-seryl-tRNA(Sec) selenium transferase [Armatimonadota bacterium]|nr:L-seryl-tRNA(Sec) selenium transferase [Armatimonadota bacterium]